MSEYIVELDSKHSIALKIAFAEEMRGGDFVRGEIVRCRDCRYLARETEGICYHPRAQGYNNDLWCDPDGFCKWGERRSK